MTMFGYKLTKQFLPGNYFLRFAFGVQLLCGHGFVLHAIHEYSREHKIVLIL